ncbi:MAG: hypothetical protein PHP51_01500 [Desulfotomaculaceae bacterium]|nr:hypothetical protein [Desulfotomaculaceae bacterium]MDD4767232.1 hypothetical protein [Desulfotomaculaceae bacterium]
MNQITGSFINNAALSNIVASGVRVGAKSVWGLALPLLLTVDQYGYYSLVIATAGIIIQVSVLGAPQVIMRSQDNVPLPALVLHSFLIAAVGFIVIKIFTPYQDGLILLIAMVLALAGYQITSALIKKKMMFYIIMISEFAGAAVLCINLIYVWLNKDNNVLGWSNLVLVEIISATCMLLIILLFFYTCRITISKDIYIKSYFPAIYSIGLISFIDVFVWKRMEVYFLQASPSGIEGVAVFSLALMIYNAFIFIPNSVVEAWYPSIAAQYISGIESFHIYIKEKIIKFTKIYFLFCTLSFPLIVLLLRLMFHSYWQWSSYILIIAGAALFFGFECFCSSVLYSTGHEKKLYFPAVSGAIIALVLNATITVRYSLNGVIFAYIITHGYIFVVLVKAFFKVYGVGDQGSKA